MSRKIIAITILCIMIFSSTSASGSTLFNEPRVRIDNVEVPLLKCGKPIKIGDDFTVIVNITNNRLLFRFNGEIRVYLTCAGVSLKEIGRKTGVVVPSRYAENVPIDCKIDELDANSIQEKYNIIVELYENKIFGWLKRQDKSTIESVNIVTKFWEKEKVKITRFRSPDTWKPDLTGLLLATSAMKIGSINVTVANDGAYDFDILVRVDLIEKPSMGIPLIEGFGELRKEIGRTIYHLEPYEEKRLPVFCYLNEADREKKEFDVKAILFVDIDGDLYQVDESTIQTVKVELSSWDEIKDNLFLAWLIFVGIIITLLLFGLLVRVIWPFFKGEPIKFSLEKTIIEKSTEKMNKRRGK